MRSRVGPFNKTHFENNRQDRHRLVCKLNVGPRKSPNRFEEKKIVFKLVLGHNKSYVVSRLFWINSSIRSHHFRFPVDLVDKSDSGFPCNGKFLDTPPVVVGIKSTTWRRLKTPTFKSGSVRSATLFRRARLNYRKPHGAVARVWNKKRSEGKTVIFR